MNSLGYFLLGYFREHLNLSGRLEPAHEAMKVRQSHVSESRREAPAAPPDALAVRRDARLLAGYEVSGADHMAAATAGIAVANKQAEPEHFDAILLLAHGTPDTLGEMDAYLNLVTGGRGVPPHVVHELQERYAQIGLETEPSPEGPHLTRWTLLQGRLLQERIGVPVYVAMRNWKPFIADVAAGMKADGVKKVRAICLAPQNSRTSVGLYRRALETAAARAFLIDFVSGWAEHPLLVQAYAETMRTALEAAQATGARTAVLHTAHSVPCRTIQASAKPIEHHGMVLATEPDTYAIECKTTAKLIAAELADILDERDWYFCFQSQGLSGGPWIGPSVEDMLAALKGEGYTHAVLQPVGFLCDHVEILYDIDIAFQQTAQALGITISRAASLNDSPTLIAALADLARRGTRSEPPQASAPEGASELIRALTPLDDAVPVAAA